MVVSWIRISDGENQKHPQPYIEQPSSIEMEIDQFLPHIVGLGLLLLLSSFFSGSETALCALSKVQIERLRAEKRKSSVAIVRFVENPRRLLITVLLGNTFVNTAFATVSASLIYRLFGESSSGLAILTATALITLLLLILGEITPKTYAVKYAEAVARITARPLWGFSVLISPLRTILKGIIDLLLPLFGGSHIPQADLITDEDFKAMVSTYAGEALQVDEGEILHNILELRHIEAKEIMIPRTEMASMDTSATIQEVLDHAKAVGLSRISLHRKQIDNICGIFHVKDLPFWRNADIRNLTIEDFLAKRPLLVRAQSEDTLVRPPFFVLETKKIADLLSELTREKTKMAILLDEYGGVSGIVTIEDIIEEVVGDIIDEHDKSPNYPEILRRPGTPSVIEVSGRVSVRHLNQQLNLKINEEIADTIGGYVSGLFGRIPSVGEFQVDENGIRFEVAATEGNLIGAVMMTLPQSVEDATPPEKPSLSPPPPSTGGTKDVAPWPPRGRGGRNSVSDSRLSRKMRQRFLIFFSVLICCCILIGATPSSHLASPPAASLLTPVLLTVALIVFLILIAFYAGCETALVSLNKVRMSQLAEEGNKRAQIIKNLVETPEKMLGMTLVGTNLMHVATSELGLLLVIALLQASEATQRVVEKLRMNETLVATVLITVLVLIFGEILPKTLFRVKADALALRYAYPIRISEIALGGIVHVVTRLTNFLVKIVGQNATPVSPDAQRAELRLLATMGEQSGGLLREQRRMIHNVLDLQNRTVEQVMVPLVDIVAVEKDTDLETFYRIASESGFSRIPVYEGRIDNITGVVHLLDVIYSNGDAKTIQPFIRTDLQFVPESKNINVLLKDIQRNRNLMAFVVDEYGGIVGLVTVKDLVEEIVGEVSDNRGEVSPIRVIRPGLIECKGRAEIDTLRDRFGVQIPSGDYETIAGYILERMGTIPKPGDQIETEGLVITISDADARNIRRVRIRSKGGNFIKRDA